jgi:C1A family cysteine protease
VYDQGDLGSCTANGIAAAIQFVQPAVMPSRLFIYYNERVIEDDVDQDAGAQIHDGIKCVHIEGCIPETEWPYDITKFAVQPTDQCYTDALTNLINDYSCLNTNMDIKQCLHSGYPVVFGMTVYESFEDPVIVQTGLVPMPGTNEQQIGGHCMLIVGYDNSRNSFIFRNSWGLSYGMAGYGYVPYEYIAQYASDFWTIK